MMAILLKMGVEAMLDAPGSMHAGTRPTKTGWTYLSL
jgi:hypothetical protein